MHRQPQSTLRNPSHRVGCAGWKEEVVAGFELVGSTPDFEGGGAGDQHHPFILLLDVLRLADGGGAHDALHLQVSLLEKCLEALTLGGRSGVGEEVAADFRQRSLARASFYRIDSQQEISGAGI